MHYVELDVNNLRRWLDGTIRRRQRGSVPNGGSRAPSTCPMDMTGYVVYFSDRRWQPRPRLRQHLDNPVVTDAACRRAASR